LRWEIGFVSIYQIVRIQITVASTGRPGGLLRFLKTTQEQKREIHVTPIYSVLKQVMAMPKTFDGGIFGR